jgi:hypothetical protein
MARQWSARCYGVARQRDGSRLCENSLEPRTRGIVFSIAFSQKKSPVQSVPTATPGRPACPSRASGWSSLTTPWGFPCCVRFPCVHAVATTPAQRLGVLLRSLHPAVSAFPERVVGSACALSFSRLARRSLALRPAHSRRHQFVTRYPKASATSLPP